MTSKLFAQSPNRQFSAYCSCLESDRILHFTISAKTPLTWQAVLSGWQHDSELRSLTTTLLAQVPYPAYFWEMPPLTPVSQHQPWECVVVNAPTLATVTATPKPFAAQLGRSGDTICQFPNLGGDALLVVPAQAGPISAYPHLAAFVRNAPESQIDALWQVLGYAIEQRLETASEMPLWVSTSGLGVYWLHVRLDTAPKYYTYAPYRHLS